MLHTTALDFLAMPPSYPPRELLNGEIVERAAATSARTATALNVLSAIALWQQLWEAGGRAITAPFDVVLGQDTVLEPDVIYLTPARISALFRGHLLGAPDLAVEIFSGKREREAMETKRPIYEAHKVRELWLVDLDRRRIAIVGYDPEFARLATIAAGEGDDPLPSKALDGLVIRPSEIFQGL